MTIEELQVELLKTYEKIEPTFIEKALPFNMNVKWAALRMEIFFICGLCEYFSCEKVIESGTGLGFSALMFERYYRGTGINITTVDNCTRNRGMFDNTVDPIEFLIGDGHKLIPELIATNKDKKIGLEPESESSVEEMMGEFKK